MRVCAALCFVYCVLWGCVLDYQWLDFGSSDYAASVYNNHFDGYCMIRTYKAQAAACGDTMTERTLRRMVRDYNELGHPGLQSKADWVLAETYLTVLYPDLDDPDTFLPMIYYVDGAELTDFYGRRQQALERRLERERQEGLLTAADVAMLLEMDSRVETPWRYEWAQGWDYAVGSLGGMGRRTAPFLAFALAFVFSWEWHSGTAPLLHAAKYGRRKLALARIFSGLAFTAELFALVAGGRLLAQLVYLGTDGWDIPIQVTDPLAVAPWNMLQAEAFAMAFVFGGMIGYACLVMLLSAWGKSGVRSLVLALAIVYVPDLLEGYLPRWVQSALEILPLVRSANVIYRTDVYHILGRGVWAPYLLIAVPVPIALACVPLAVRQWSRRQRT